MANSIVIHFILFFIIILILIIATIGGIYHWNISCFNIPEDFDKLVHYDRGDPESNCCDRCQGWINEQSEYWKIKSGTQIK